MGAGSAAGGGISDNEGESVTPSLAFTPGGAPVIAWVDDNSGPDAVYVLRHNGSAWVEMGAGSDSGDGISDANYSENPSLAAGYGEVAVAWDISNVDGQQIYVRRWDGAAWVELGGSASGGGVSANSGRSESPSLAILPDGAPIVAWHDTDSGDVHQEIYVRRWDGTNWIELGGSATGGGISNNAGYSVDPALAIMPDGAPVVAWSDNTDGDYEIFVRRWDGSAWVELGANSASSGGISDNAHWSRYTALAVGPDGAPVVAWQDSDGYAEIYLRRWNGATWAELGDSAANEGVSIGGIHANRPALAIAPNGQPIVAWYDSLSRPGDIFVRRWDGAAWVEVGAGSATGGGVSETAGESAYPALAFGPDGRVYVSWEDKDDGDAEIYLRRSQPLLAVCYALSRSHTGQGADPAADPVNSTDCAPGSYTAGQAISLSAAPSAGWRVSGWSGTANDAATATTNSLIMPAAAHAVSVTYAEIPPPTDWVYAPMIVHQPVPCLAGPNELEPNNTQTQANGPLCNRQTYSGLPTDAFDIFYFDVGLTADVAATLDNHAGNGVQLALHYQTVTPNPIDLDYIAADGFRVSAANAAPGRYYVVIYAATPGPATPYTLRAEWE